MASLTITRGLPGSGKTTYRTHVIGAYGGIGVSRDDLRLSLFNDRGRMAQADEDYLTGVHRDIVKRHLKADRDVIVDDTNYRNKTCREWRDLAQSFEAAFHIADFRNVPLEDCLKRVSARAAAGGHDVPEQYIRDAHKRFIRGRKLDEPLAETPAKKASPFEEYIPDTDLPPAFIVDVDGTLALNNGRNVYDFSRLGEDSVNESLRKVLVALYWSPQVEILIATGRPADYVLETEDWLYENDVPYTEILSRGDEGVDMRSDDIVKYEILQAYAQHYNILGVFDDRPKVLRMWRQVGLTTFQLGNGAEF